MNFNISGLQTEFVDLVSKDREIKNIAEYILTKFGEKYSLDEDDVLKVSSIVYKRGFNSREAKSGQIDSTIKVETKKYLAMKRSVRQPNETPIKTLVATIKKNAKPIIITTGVATLAAVAFGTAALGVRTSKEMKFDGKANDEFGYNVGDYVVNQGRATAYNNNKTAKNIYDDYSNNPSLRDAVILFTYLQMNHNRLENMEQVFQCLKNYDQSITSFSSFKEYVAETLLKYHQIDAKDYNAYLVYIKSSGITPEIEAIMKKYRDLRVYFSDEWEKLSSDVGLNQVVPIQVGLDSELEEDEPGRMGRS